MCISSPAPASIYKLTHLYPGPVNREDWVETHTRTHVCSHKHRQKHTHTQRHTRTLEVGPFIKHLWWTSALFSDFSVKTSIHILLQPTLLKQSLEKTLDYTVRPCLANIADRCGCWKQAETEIGGDTWYFTRDSQILQYCMKQECCTIVWWLWVSNLLSVVSVPPLGSNQCYQSTRYITSTHFPSLVNISAHSFPAHLRSIFFHVWGSWLHDDYPGLSAHRRERQCCQLLRGGTALPIKVLLSAGVKWVWVVDRVIIRWKGMHICQSQWQSGIGHWS